jgi:hypothetical protein
VLGEWKFATVVEKGIATYSVTFTGHECSHLNARQANPSSELPSNQVVKTTDSRTKSRTEMF